MNEETLQKILDVLKSIDASLKAPTKTAVSAEAFGGVTVGSHIEADVKITSDAKGWGSGGGWFYNAQIDYNGGTLNASLGVNRKTTDEVFRQGDVLFLRLQKGNATKRGEPLFWLSELLSENGKQAQSVASQTEFDQNVPF